MNCPQAFTPQALDRPRFYGQLFCAYGSVAGSRVDAARASVCPDFTGSNTRWANRQSSRLNCSLRLPAKLRRTWAETRGWIGVIYGV